MPPSLRVLVVDASDETQEVLRSALASRGMESLAARDVQQGVDLASQCRPDCVVLDLEIEAHRRGATPATVAQRMSSALADSTTPVVILGTMRRESREARERLPGEFVAKPYHYGALVRKIESLVSEARTSMAPRA